MRKSLSLTGTLGMLVALMFSTVGCNSNDTKPDTYTKDKKLIVSIRNLYLSDYDAADPYLSELEEQFGIKFNLTKYSWDKWGSEVTSSINGKNLPDVFHADVDSYNFGFQYKFWAQHQITKPLPTDLSPWPYLKESIENATNVDALKVNGKLYGIPVAKNTTDYSTTYSPFTYIYRRDWAKEVGAYQENDEYTWKQFEDLLEAFRIKFADSSRSPLGDVKWGYPSIINFYKQVPHCFAFDSTANKYVCNYTTDEYITGLQKAKSFKSKGWYNSAQNEANEDTMTQKYYGNQLGVLYENLSLSNYLKIRTGLAEANTSFSEAEIDDAAAIMKIKSPVDNKYALEGTDNWFSMTLFDYRISDKKMNLILDVLNWLLSPEGTKFSVYGDEGIDYVMDGDEVKLIERSWPKDDKGKYADKQNAGKYIRYLASLGNDNLVIDPLTDKHALSILDNWDAEMKTALANGTLRVLQENEEVMWLATTRKARHSNKMLDDALANVMDFIYNTNGITTVDKFKAAFKLTDARSTWYLVLKEINDKLGYR